MYIMQMLKVHIPADNGLADYRKQIPHLLESLLATPDLKQVTLVGSEDGNPSALSMLLVIWESREAADTWMRGARYRKFLEGVRPYLSGEVPVTFFSLEGVGFNYAHDEFDPKYDQVEEVDLGENKQEASQ